MRHRIPMILAPLRRHVPGLQRLAARALRLPPQSASSVPVLLALAACGIVLLLSFLEVIDDTLEGDTRALDLAILRALRNPADMTDPAGPLWLQEMMRDFTGLGGIGVLTFVTLAASAYLYLDRKKFRAGYLLCAILTGTVLTNLLKSGFDRPRPDFMPYESVVYTASLPSGHSMMSALVYLTLGALLAESQSRNRLKLFIVLIAALATFLVGVSRLYLGVHWPTDVVAGWLAGAAWAILFLLIEKTIISYRGMEPRPGHTRLPVMKQDKPHTGKPRSVMDSPPLVDKTRPKELDSPDYDPEKRKKGKRVDEASAESFPASDPPSYTRVTVKK